MIHDVTLLLPSLLHDTLTCSHAMGTFLSWPACPYGAVPAEGW